MTKHILSLSIALTGACLLLNTTSFAEDAKPPGGPDGGPGGHRPPPNPEERVKHMKETLGLTDDQAAKLLDIFKKSGDQRKAIMDDTASSKEDKHTKMEELGKTTRTEIEAVLTPEQQAKAKAEMEKRRGEHRGGPGAAGGAPGGPGTK